MRELSAKGVEFESGPADHEWGIVVALKMPGKIACGYINRSIPQRGRDESQTAAGPRLMLFYVRQIKLQIDERVIVIAALRGSVQKRSSEQMSVPKSQLNSVPPRAGSEQVDFLADELSVSGIC